MREAIREGPGRGLELGARARDGPAEGAVDYLHVPGALLSRSRVQVHTHTHTPPRRVP